MSQKKRILITNDDGIHAPGLLHLWKALQKQYDLSIVAPAVEQSSVGMSITIRVPLQVKQLDWHDHTPAWAVSGTPADCVKMARSVLLREQPDLIVSGINRGSNEGRNILYSGTVGGVIEGVMRNVPGIAFSVCDYSSPDFSQTQRWIQAIVSDVLEHPLPQGSILNVNFPKLTPDGYRGIKLTRQGKRHWGEEPVIRKHPSEDNDYYWLGARLTTFDEHQDCDVEWLEKGYITAVPVHVQELTDHLHIQQHKDRFESLG